LLSSIERRSRLGNREHADLIAHADHVLESIVELEGVLDRL
jgi:hypothetical protein